MRSCRRSGDSPEDLLRISHITTLFSYTPSYICENPYDTIVGTHHIEPADRQYRRCVAGTHTQRPVYYILCTFLFFFALASAVSSLLSFCSILLYQHRCRNRILDSRARIVIRTRESMLVNIIWKSTSCLVEISRLNLHVIKLR